VHAPNHSHTGGICFSLQLSDTMMQYNQRYL